MRRMPANIGEEQPAAIFKRLRGASRGAGYYSYQQRGSAAATSDSWPNGSEPVVDRDMQMSASVMATVRRSNNGASKSWRNPYNSGNMLRMRTMPHFCRLRTLQTRRARRSESNGGAEFGDDVVTLVNGTTQTYRVGETASQAGPTDYSGSVWLDSRDANLPCELRIPQPSNTSDLPSEYCRTFNANGMLAKGSSGGQHDI